MHTNLITKVKRNALSLMQGLDITMKIRKDVGPRKPIVVSIVSIIASRVFLILNYTYAHSPALYAGYGKHAPHLKRHK